MRVAPWLTSVLGRQRYHALGVACVEGGVIAGDEVAGGVGGAHGALPAMGRAVESGAQAV